MTPDAAVDAAPDRMSAPDATPDVALDALHLAMASDAGADLATFDQRLAEAARAHGLSVLS